MPSRKRMRSFRVGAINAAGGKPRDPESEVYKCVVASHVVSSAVTAGDHCTLDVMNYNTPLNMVNTTTWGVSTGIAAGRHPSGHVDVLAHGYNTYLVLKSYYQIFLRWNGLPHDGVNWVFMYKFNTDATSNTPALTASLVTAEIWLDLQASEGWVWKRFSCNPADNWLPSSGMININVPDCVKLGIRLHASQVGSFTIDDLQGTVADSTAGPNNNIFLHLMWIRIPLDGVDHSAPAIVAGDVKMEIRCTQTVKLMKDQGLVELIDEGDVV